MRRIWIIGALFVLLLASGDAAAQHATIDPRVLEDTANGAVGRFLVVLKAQTPARALAASTPDRAARGRRVFDALRATAHATQPALRARLDALGAAHRAYYVANVIAVEGTRAVVDALAARADVLAIESDRAFRVPLESPTGVRAPAGVEWNISRVGAPALWARGYTGQGMVYANGDTGVYWEHPALKLHYRGWNGVADHNYNWWDAVRTPIVGGSACGYATNVPCDDYGHGTHVMGIGIGDDGVGNQIGMAPGAQWIACRNMDRGYGRPSTYIECMEFFLAPWDLNGQNPDPDKRPDAVGNSYGCPPSELCAPNSLQAALENLRAAGVFMAVSAGNDGSACSTIDDPPALDDAAITVGATDYLADTIASFSSRGPVTIDGSNRRKPDFVAPGVNVRSSVLNGAYGDMGGTSVASPHVAGAVVLLWSAFPALRRNVDVTESILAQTALHLTTTQGCGGDSATQVPNNVYGYGRLDVSAAYDFIERHGLPPYRYFFPIILKDD